MGRRRHGEGVRQWFEVYLVDLESLEKGANQVDEAVRTAGHEARACAGRTRKPYMSSRRSRRSSRVEGRRTRSPGLNITPPRLPREPNGRTGCPCPHQGRCWPL